MCSRSMRAGALPYRTYYLGIVAPSLSVFSSLWWSRLRRLPLSDLLAGSDCVSVERVLEREEEGGGDDALGDLWSDT